MEIFCGQKMLDKYCCNICDYVTSKKFNYNKHLSTSKHNNTIIGNQKVAKVAKVANVENFICNTCGMQYVTNSGLWKHKLKCKIETQTKSKLESESALKMDLLKKDNLIEYLIKENSEFKGLIMELIKKDNSTNITNNTTNNTNCHNSFNLNLFLNEKCKDAINISDFVDSVKMQLSDLENFGHLGYVEGISRILIKNLNDLDTLKRPIHCSDLKREVLYIKDNNEWTKETEEKLVIKNAIKQVANKNIKQIQTWKNENPDCIHSESRKNDQYMNIVMNSMSGGTSEEQFNNISQIIKNVSKEVIINK
jgi:hypothetical protein